MTQGQRHRRLHVITVLWAREQMVGDSWQETDRPVALRRTDRDNKELNLKTVFLRGSGAARDTLPQALRHDLMMAPLLRNNTCKTINTDI